MVNDERFYGKQIEVNSWLDEQAEFTAAHNRYIQSRIERRRKQVEMQRLSSTIHPAYIRKLNKHWLNYNYAPIEQRIVRMLMQNEMPYQDSRSKWKTAEGRYIKIDVLETSHLINIIESLRERGARNNIKADEWCEEHVINWFELKEQAQFRNVWAYPHIKLGLRERLTASKGMNPLTNEALLELLTRIEKLENHE